MRRDSFVYKQSCPRGGAPYSQLQGSSVGFAVPAEPRPPLVDRGMKNRRLSVMSDPRGAGAMRAPKDTGPGLANDLCALGVASGQGLTGPSPGMTVRPRNLGSYAWPGPRLTLWHFSVLDMNVW